MIFQSIATPSAELECVSDRDGGFKQPLERCKLLIRWAFEYFDQTAWLASTRIHSAESLAELGWLRDHGPTDYRRFDREQKERLAALVNHVRALGEPLRAEVAL